ncbi:MAG: hypothetical protein ABJG15_05635 [Hyphomonadaceae bacterium]
MQLPESHLSLNVPVRHGLLSGHRFRSRAKRKTKWRNATPEEHAWLKAQPDLDPLGDFLCLAPKIDDELWLLIERVWNGFPDPPKFAFVAYDKDLNLIVAKDFQHCPSRWSLPEPEAL